MKKKYRYKDIYNESRTLNGFFFKIRLDSNKSTLSLRTDAEST